MIFQILDKLVPLYLWTPQGSFGNWLMESTKFSLHEKKLWAFKTIWPERNLCWHISTLLKSLETKENGADNVTTPAHLHIDILDKSRDWLFKWTNSQAAIQGFPELTRQNKENRPQIHQVYIQHWKMKEATKQFSLNTFEIYAPDFDHDIDGGSVGPTDADQEASKEPVAALLPTSRAVSIACSLVPDRCPPECMLPFYLNIHWHTKEIGQYEGQDQLQFWTNRTSQANRRKLERHRTKHTGHKFWQLGQSKNPNTRHSTHHGWATWQLPHPVTSDEEPRFSEFAIQHLMVRPDMDTIQLVTGSH